MFLDLQKNKIDKNPPINPPWIAMPPSQIARKEGIWIALLNRSKVVKNLSLRQEQKDLIILKKALFLIKISKTDEGKKLLKKLIEGDSKFKSLSEEILNS